MAGDEFIWCVQRDEKTTWMENEKRKLTSSSLFSRTGSLASSFRNEKGREGISRETGVGNSH